MSDLEVIDAINPVEVSVADDVIADLRKRLTGLTANTHPDYELVRAGIAEVSTIRTGVESARKKLVGPYVSAQKVINAKAKMAKESLLEIETPLREEKARVDDAAERKRQEREEEERLAIASKFLAEEEAKREEERKVREAANAQLAEERKELEAGQLELKKKNEELASERKEIEADKRAVLEDARLRELVEREESEAEEAAEQKVRDDEERGFRLIKEKAEQERLVEERKPDQQKLRDFVYRLQSVELPQLATDWGRNVLENVCDNLQSAVDIANLYRTGTEDELAAADAAETVNEQSPKECNGRQDERIFG